MTDSTAMASSIDRIRKPGRLTLGVELPLDNDWAPEREAKRQTAGTPFGIPDLSAYPQLVRQVDRSGFAAVWMRDVPVFDPHNFGDAGSVYDPFVNFGYLAGITENVVIGTAAVVLPLRHPLMVAKAVASADQLSGGRVILGVASGDRPVEYPLMGVDFESRGEIFRDSVNYLQEIWREGGISGLGPQHPSGLDLLPRPLQKTVPMVIAGAGRQSPEWIARHMDGRFVYPGSSERLAMNVKEWRDLRARIGLPNGVFISAFHLDLAADPLERATPLHFGARIGRQPFIEHLRSLNTAGLDHLALLLRPSRRPLDEVIDEIAQEVISALD
jgi:luciferase-type oxidoreductase